MFGNSSMFGPHNYVSIGPVAKGLLSAAGMAAPFPYSLGPALLQAGLRGWNTANTDAVRGNMNAIGQAPAVPPLNFGQIIGSLLNWNGYGDEGGNQTIVTRDQYRNPLTGQPVGISTGGLSWDSYGPFGLFGTHDPIGMLTPGEDSTKRAMVGLAAYLAAQRAANGNNGFGNGVNANVGFGPGNYASPTGAPSGPAITSGGNAGGAANNSGSQSGGGGNFGGVPSGFRM